MEADITAWPAANLDLLRPVIKMYGLAVRFNQKIVVS